MASNERAAAETAFGAGIDVGVYLLLADFWKSIVRLYVYNRSPYQLPLTGADFVALDCLQYNRAWSGYSVQPAIKLGDITLAFGDRGWLWLKSC
jgi:hypothetical protein